MTLWQSAVLGIVQGLTEFLPVSSTAHLKIAEALMGIPRGDPFLTSFDVIIQLGTLVSVLVYFRRDLGAMVAGVLRGLKGEERHADPSVRMAAYLVLGTIPVGVAGLLFDHSIARLDQGESTLLLVIAVCLISIAGVLLWAEQTATQQRTLDQIGDRDAFVIGLAQALAIVPGVSRAGITLAAGLFRGMRRDDAARFSFLLSIPAVGLAGLWKLQRLIRHHEWVGGTDAMLSLALGTIISAAVGYAVIALLLRFLRTRKTYPFIVWRVAMGLWLLWVVFARGTLSA
jgi:undecaprenyl-diphosphatase